MTVITRLRGSRSVAPHFETKSPQLCHMTIAGGTFGLSGLTAAVLLAVSTTSFMSCNGTDPGNGWWPSTRAPVSQGRRRSPWNGWRASMTSRPWSTGSPSLCPTVAGRWCSRHWHCSSDCHATSKRTGLGLRLFRPDPAPDPARPGPSFQLCSTARDPSSCCAMRITLHLLCDSIVHAQGPQALLRYRIDRWHSGIASQKAQASAGGPGHCPNDRRYGYPGLQTPPAKGKKGRVLGD